MILNTICGKTVIVDEGYDTSWSGGRYYVTDRGYCIAYDRTKSSMALLHRRLVGAKPGEIVDHINGNRLDNRICNLRICTHSENCKNRLVYGFHEHVGRNGKIKYRGRVLHKGKRYQLGNFATKEEARAAYIKFYKENDPCFIPRLRTIDNR